MTTPRIRSLVSALTVTLALAGCASAAPRVAWEGTAAAEEAPLTVRFDNDAHDFVHVYLISDRREWRLGRVEAWSRATLKIPEDALAGHPGSMRLAVLAGQRVSARVVAEPRAAITLPQPAAVFLAQRWMFSQGLAQGQLTALPRGRARPETSVP